VGEALAVAGRIGGLVAGVLAVGLAAWLELAASGGLAGLLPQPVAKKAARAKTSPDDTVIRDKRVRPMVTSLKVGSDRGYS
jgi:hypothetical protein